MVITFRMLGISAQGVLASADCDCSQLNRGKKQYYFTSQYLCMPCLFKKLLGRRQGDSPVRDAAEKKIRSFVSNALYSRRKSCCGFWARDDILCGAPDKYAVLSSKMCTCPTNNDKSIGRTLCFRMHPSAIPQMARLEIHDPNRQVRVTSPASLRICIRIKYG